MKKEAPLWAVGCGLWRRRLGPPWGERLESERPRVKMSQKLGTKVDLEEGSVTWYYSY